MTTNSIYHIHVFIGLKRYTKVPLNIDSFPLQSSVPPNLYPWFKNMYLKESLTRSIRRIIYKFLNVCSFDYTAVAGSGKVERS